MSADAGAAPEATPDRAAPSSAASLRRTLTRLVLLAVLLVACVQAVIVYRTARAETEVVFDAQMERIALSLTGGIAAALLDDDLLADDEHAREFIIQVWRADGTMLYRSPSAHLLPPQAVLGFSAVQAGGASYRVYALQTPLQVIQVAQATAVRREMAGQLALRAMLPVLILAPVLMLIVWWVIGRAMAPVERLRAQVAQRRHDDLTLLPGEGLPAELQPLVGEMNGLLSRLDAAWQALQHFTADAAHELRSPLAALRLQVQSLQRAEDPQARRVATERLLAGVDRATRMVEQLLVLARVERDDARPTAFVPVNLAGLASAAVADHQWQAQSAEVDLVMLPCADAAGHTIRGHPEAIAVLIRNLLDNALRATPAGGRIRVQVFPEGRGVDGARIRELLMVEDSGPGIPAEQRQRVLDRFYRAAGAVGHGSGLGLAIVHAIAQQHGARLQLDDSPELGGLRVRVAFPVNG